MRSWYSSMVAGCVSCYVRQALIIPSYEFLEGAMHPENAAHQRDSWGYSSGRYLTQGLRTSRWDFLFVLSFLFLSLSLSPSLSDGATFMHQPLAIGRNLPVCQGKQTVLDDCSCTVAGANAKRFPFWRLILAKTLPEGIAVEGLQRAAWNLDDNKRLITWDHW